MEQDAYYLALQTGFASEYAFYLKAQNFHWNTVGRCFYEDHLLFGRIYEEVGGIIDTYAENLRKLQVMAPASFSQMGTLSIVGDAPATPPAPDAMLKQLLADSDKLTDLFRSLYEACEEAGDHGFANFFADRQDAHAGHSWMLRSCCA